MSRAQLVAIGLLLTALGVLPLAACGSVSTPTPTVPPVLHLELAYWDKTHPLVQRAAREAGTPLSEVFLAHYSGIMTSQTDAWDEFVVAINASLPVYEEVFAEWLKIQPPSVGKTPELHRAYSLAWNERVRSLTLLSFGWEHSDSESLELGIASWAEANARGIDAERLRVDFNTYLSDLCQVHRLPDCL